MKQHNLSTKIFLAPMEGVIDAPFRHLITQLGSIDLCMTEFLRVTDRLLPDKSFYKICPELNNSKIGHTPAETPVLLQLLGGQPQPMAENAQKAIELGAPGIDLNFGCPAKTVNRHDGGASLLQYPDRIYKITKAVSQAIPKGKTFSVKIRLGFNDKTLAIENSLAAQEGGAHWLTVHARTKKEGYQPPAHWQWISKIKEHLTIPIVANGDIWNQQDYESCRQITLCSHFMLGRGAVALPNLAQIIKKSDSPLKWSKVGEMVSQLFYTCLYNHPESLRDPQYINEKYAIARTKQWLKLLGRNYPQAQTIFDLIKKETLLEGFTKKIKDLHPQGMSHEF